MHNLLIAETKIENLYKTVMAITCKTACLETDFLLFEIDVVSLDFSFSVSPKHSEGEGRRRFQWAGAKRDTLVSKSTLCRRLLSLAFTRNQSHRK
ncbi:hypothetical protein CEXT_661031 [Caerostris extrusa]|uniref:Uncharacterized protein n=1 Tax=Caerostris extrusa TaxID=172846 RepID=A0AAV4NF88_CAEEX|nr:hypothetical protein CEXT_661031 [Caerostris extrusa]